MLLHGRDSSETTVDSRATAANGPVDEAHNRFSYASDSTTLVGHTHIFTSEDKIRSDVPVEPDRSTILLADQRELWGCTPSAPDRLLPPLDLPLDCEEFKKGIAIISSAASKDLTPAAIGDLSPNEVGRIMEEHGTSLMVYHLSLVMHQRSGVMLANIRKNKDAIFGQGNTLERHSDILNSQQRKVFDGAINEWGEGFRKEWRGIVDDILLSQTVLEV